MKEEMVDNSFCPSPLQIKYDKNQKGSIGFSTKEVIIILHKISFSGDR